MAEFSNNFDYFEHEKKQGRHMIRQGILAGVAMIGLGLPLSAVHVNRVGGELGTHQPDTASTTWEKVDEAKGDIADLMESLGGLLVASGALFLYDLRQEERSLQDSLEDGPENPGLTEEA